MTNEEMQILRDIMREEIGAALQSVTDRLEKLEAGQERLETDVRHTRVLLEKQEHNVSLIAEQYGDIALKLERVREIDDLRDRVRTLETVVRNHSAKLREVGQGRIIQSEPGQL